MLVVWLGGELRNAVVCIPDDRLRQTVNDSVQISCRLERLYPRQGCIIGCLVRFPVTSRKIVLFGHTWWRRYTIDLVDDRMMVRGAVVQSVMRLGLSVKRRSLGCSVFVVFFFCISSYRFGHRACSRIWYIMAGLPVSCRAGLVGDFLRTISVTICRCVSKHLAIVALYRIGMVFELFCSKTDVPDVP